MEAYDGPQIVGMDLHRRRLVLVRMAEDGHKLSTARIANSPARLAAEIKRAGLHPKVVLEACYGWYWAADTLAAAGTLSRIQPPHQGKRRKHRVRRAAPRTPHPRDEDLPLSAPLAGKAPVAGPEHRRDQARRAIRPRHLHRTSHLRVLIDRQRARPYDRHGESPPADPFSHRTPNRSEKGSLRKATNPPQS